MTGNNVKRGEKEDVASHHKKITSSSAKFGLSFCPVRSAHLRDALSTITQHPFYLVIVTDPGGIHTSLDKKNKRE